MSALTATEAAARVEKVNGGDPEEGHIDQDKLLWDFVEGVASGEITDPWDVAWAILKIDRTKMRWFS